MTLERSWGKISNQRHQLYSRERDTSSRLGETAEVCESSLQEVTEHRNVNLDGSPTNFRVFAQNVVRRTKIPLLGKQITHSPITKNFSPPFSAVADVFVSVTASFARESQRLISRQTANQISTPKFRASTSNHKTTSSNTMVLKYLGVIIGLPVLVGVTVVALIIYWFIMKAQVRRGVVEQREREMEPYVANGH